MADEHKYDEEEYHFSEHEENEPYETSPEEPTPGDSAGGSVKFRRVIVVIGLVVVILAVYKVLGMFFAPGHLIKTGQQAAVPKANFETKPASITPPTTFTPANESVTSETTSAEGKAVEQKLAKLEIAEDSTKSDINNLNSSVTDLKSGLNDLTNKITELNTTISNLTNVVQQQQQQLAALALKKKPKPRKMIVKQPSHWHGYFVQAIIAGRAWLKSVNGATITVRTGSRIPGVGVVKIIDPRRGIVVVSSGEIIRFSPGER